MRRNGLASGVRLLSPALDFPMGWWPAPIVAMAVAGVASAGSARGHAAPIDEAIHLATTMRRVVTIDGIEIASTLTAPDRVSVRPDGAVEVGGEHAARDGTKVAWSIVVGSGMQDMQGMLDMNGADGIEFAAPEGIASPAPMSYWVVSKFGTNNAAPAAINFNFAVDSPLTDLLVQYVGGGSFGLLTDANGDGATISAPPGDAIYTSLIDEATVGQAMAFPFSATAPAGSTCWFFGSHGDPIPSDAAPPVTFSYGHRLSYLLAGGDAAEITSIVVIQR